MKYHPFRRCVKIAYRVGWFFAIMIKYFDFTHFPYLPAILILFSHGGYIIWIESKY